MRKDTELYNEELRSEESLRGRPGRLSRVPASALSCGSSARMRGVLKVPSRELLV